MGKDKRSLQQARAKKLAREAAKKKKQKRAAAQQPRSRFADLGFSRAELDHAPIHAAYASRRVFEDGIGQAVLARRLPDGRVVVGVFLVDAYCLGVKNAFLTVQTPTEFQEMVEARFDAAGLQTASPAYVRKLVEDSIVYARNLGFEPHPDYRDAALVLGDIDPSECADAFTFGRNGKPLYVSGPNETEAQSRRIVDQLMRRCGKDGAHYVVRVAGPGAEDEETDDKEGTGELEDDDDDETVT